MGHDLTAVPLNYDRFINRISRARQPCKIRVATQLLLSKPHSDMISFAAGMPNEDLFPITEVTLKLRDGSTRELKNKTLNIALQYGMTEGEVGLREWSRNLLKVVHNPPTLARRPEDGGLNLCISNGNADGLNKAFEMFVEQGDNVIVECQTYSNALQALRPLGCHVIPVDSDQYGMSDVELRKTLSKWSPSDSNNPQSDVPKFMYVIPTGDNPTGTSMTLERKNKIYQIAREYNMLIVEDDPYYFLQFSEELTPSFLSMDVDGRVLRLDSFSKVFAPGLRLGIVSGPAVLIERYKLHFMVAGEQPSTLSQMVFLQVVKEWGIDGFLRHTREITRFYKIKKDYLIATCERWLSEYAEWNEPVAGMFLWLKLKHVKDSRKLMEKAVNEKSVLMVPGCAFFVDEDKLCSYVRLSFSLASNEQMDLGIERFANLLREEATEKID